MNNGYNFPLVTLMVSSLVVLFSIAFLFFDWKAVLCGTIAFFPVLIVLMAEAIFFKGKYQCIALMFAYSIGVFLTMVLCEKLAVRNIHTIICSIIIPIGNVALGYFVTEVFKASVGREVKPN